jgi:hypothetical protein
MTIRGTAVAGSAAPATRAAAAKQTNAQIRSFPEVLLFTGCRYRCHVSNAAEGRALQDLTEPAAETTQSEIVSEPQTNREPYPRGIGV